MTYWWLGDPDNAPDTYHKSCKWCPAEDQSSCSDPVCRGRGYGEMHRDACPGKPPGRMDACTCRGVL